MKRNVNSNPPRGPIFAAAALFWCGFTFWFDAQFAWTMGRQASAGIYSATTGTLITADAARVPPRRGHRRACYQAVLRYSYVVDGKQYEATRLRYDVREGSLEEIQQHLAKYPRQQPVTVYYNSRAPEEAVLENNFDLESIAAFIIGFMPFNAAAFGFIGFFLCWPLSRWLGRPVIAVSVRDNQEQTRIRIYENSPALHALAGLGLIGVMSLFGVAALRAMIPLMPALIGINIAGLVMFSGMTFAWWNARSKFVELRRDHVRGIVEIGQGDGTFTLATESALELAWPKRRDPESSLLLPLRFVDANQRRRTVRLPRQATSAEATEIVNWLNRLLRLN